MLHKIKTKNKLAKLILRIIKVNTILYFLSPERGRSLAGGIVAGAYYIFSFLATKSFYWLQRLLGVHGVFYFYGTMSTVGLVFLYYMLPETEGRTLEDIETNYKSKKKGTFSKGAVQGS